MAGYAPEITFALASLVGVLSSSRLTGNASIGRARFALVLCAACASQILVLARDGTGQGGLTGQLSFAAAIFALTLSLVMRCRDLGLRPEAAVIFLFVPAGIMIPALSKGRSEGCRLPRSGIADGWPALLGALVVLVVATAVTLQSLIDSGMLAFHEP